MKNQNNISNKNEMLSETIGNQNVYPIHEGQRNYREDQPDLFESHLEAMKISKKQKSHPNG